MNMLHSFKNNKDEDNSPKRIANNAKIAFVTLISTAAMHCQYIFFLFETEAHCSK